MQKPQVMEKTNRVPKITQQVENIQYQLQQDSAQNPAANRWPSGRHTCPAHSGPGGGEAAKVFKMTMQRKHPSVQTRVARWPSKSKTQQVKITQEKSQPRDQANRNSPDSRSLRSNSVAGFNSPKCPEKRGASSNAVKASAKVPRSIQRQVPMIQEMQPEDRGGTDQFQNVRRPRLSVQRACTTVSPYL